jgi:serine protease Do
MKGLIVRDLDQVGEAAKRGIRPGDVILDANQTPLENAAALKQILAQAKKAGHEFVLLRVARGNNLVFVTVAVGK